MTNQIETPLYERFAAKFEIASLQSGNEHLRALRQEAFDIFRATGFPSVKNEEWRFTNTLPYLKEAYDLEVVTSGLSKEAFEQTAKLIAAHLDEVQHSIKGEQKGAYRLVTVNGRINNDLSVLPDHNDLKILSFQDAEHEPAFEQHFGSIATVKDNAFTALNTALYTDGLYIEAPKNKALDQPLHIVNVILADAAVFLQPRHLIVVAPGASLEIIETVITDKTANPVFVNGVTEIAVAENAHFHHYDIQTGRQVSAWYNAPKPHRLQAAITAIIPLPYPAPTLYATT